MDYAKIADELQTDRAVFAEVKIYEIDDMNRTVIREINIDYGEIKDYQISLNNKIIC